MIKVFFYIISVTIAFWMGNFIERKPKPTVVITPARTEIPWMSNNENTNTGYYHSNSLSVSFSLLGEQIWETPLLACYTVIPKYIIPIDLIILSQKLAVYGNFFKMYYCPKESPCSSYLTRDELLILDVK